MTKICSKCKQDKPLEEFYPDKRAIDRLQTRCKTCQKAYRQSERGRAVERRNAQTESRKAYQRRYRQTELSKAAQQRGQQQYRINNPHKKAAHSAISNAIRDGKLERGPCEVCGTTSNVHGHHEDYDKPLDVAWLCRKHHAVEGLKGV